MASGVAVSSLTLPQVFSSCVLFSLSRAWQLGRTILRARKTHSNVVTAVVEQQQGMLLFAGKVCQSMSICAVTHIQVCMATLLAVLKNSEYSQVYAPLVTLKYSFGMLRIKEIVVPKQSNIVL